VEVPVMRKSVGGEQSSVTSAIKIVSTKFKAFLAHEARRPKGQLPEDVFVVRRGRRKEEVSYP
jgi:hypothetical protein